MPATATSLPEHLSAPYISLQEGVSLGYGAYSTLRSWIADGRLPAVKIGGRVKITVADLEALARPKVTDGTGSAQQSADNAAVARVVAAAPRLTDEQREQLATIFGGAR